MDPKSPDPWMLELLRVGQLALVLGDALFLHGGLYEEALGKVPDGEPAEPRSRAFEPAEGRFQSDSRLPGPFPGAFKVDPKLLNRWWWLQNGNES